jgi:hypothetical protein
VFKERKALYDAYYKGLTKRKKEEDEVTLSIIERRRLAVTLLPTKNLR